MAIQIVEYTSEYENRVKEFNRRLALGGVLETYFPESAVPVWLPPVEGRRIFHTSFLAVEDGIVRGGYILKHQEFRILGKTRTIAQFRLPLSEGLVNRRYVPLGVQLLLDALRRNPLLYTLGIGSRNEPMSQLLLGAKWSMFDVPFLFRVLNANNFLRQIRYLRTSRLRRTLLNALAFSGVGRPAVAVYQSLRSRPVRAQPDGEHRWELSHCDAWVDQVWEASQQSFSLAAVRDRSTLELLYPHGDKRFIWLKVLRQNEPVGWAVVSNVAMKGHAYFGDMRVGGLIDCNAMPGSEWAVAGAALSYLREHGADIAVTNQSHQVWRRALLAVGLLEGQSNYLMATSPKLSAMLDPFLERKENSHLTRGDGSGPENLIGVRPLRNPQADL